MSALFPLKLEYLAGWQALLLYLCLAIPTFWLGARSMAGMEPFRKWMSVGLRLDLLMLLVLLLAGAQWTQRIKDLSVIAVRDVSRSTQNVTTANPLGIQADISSYLKDQAHRKPVDDRVGMVAFDGSAWVDAIPGVTLRTNSSALRSATDGTDIARALQLALAVMPPDTIHRLVLFSDGNGTTGDLDQAVRAAASQHVPIDVVPLNYQIDHEIAIEKLVAPSSQKEGSPFTLDVVMHSQNPDAVRARLTITDNGSPLMMDRKTSLRYRDVTLAPGANVEHLRLPSQSGGAHDYRAEIEPLDSSTIDTMSQNNSAEAMTLVLGKSKVLYVAGPHLDSDEPLKESLIHQGMQVDECDPASAPRNLPQLQQYSTVVLSNVPRNMDGLDESQVDTLDTYVRETGGGLVVVGGPNSFGAGGWIGSKLEQLLPINCQPPARQIMPAGALIIIIDCSGSMSESLGTAGQSKEQAANEAAVLALKALSPKDQVGVIAFNSDPSWIVPLGFNDKPDATAASIRNITPGGETEIYPALVYASDAMSHVSPLQAPVRHVLLLTDGYSDSGDFNRLIAEMSLHGVTLSTVGVGSEVDEKLLRGFATLGRGRFYRVADSKTLPQIFVKEAMTLRASLIREEVFNPRLRPGASSLVAGIDALPPLLGMVRTWPKFSPAIETPILSDSTEPILADWHVGLGRVAAFTSDAERRWAPGWVGSPMFAKFWTQIVRGVARSADSGAVEASIIPTSTGQLKLHVETADTNGDLQDVPALSAKVFGPGGADEIARSVNLIQTGAGIYEADIDATQPGAYLAMVSVAGKNSPAGWTSATYVVDGSAEWQALKSDEATLRDIANRTGGRFIDGFDPNIDLFDRGDLPQQSAAMPITNPLLVLSMITLLLDVAVRRIAFDRRSLANLAGAVADFIRSFTQASVPQGQTTVAALRVVRKTTEETAEPPQKNLIGIVSTKPLGSSADKSQPAPIQSAESDPMQRLAAAKRRARENRNL